MTQHRLMAEIRGPRQRIVIDHNNGNGVSVVDGEESPLMQEAIRRGYIVKDNRIDLTEAEIGEIIKELFEIKPKRQSPSLTN